MSARRRLGALFGRLRPWQKGGVILALGVLGLVILLLLRPRPPHQEPPPRRPLVATTPADVRSGHLTVHGNGTVRPRSEIVLSPQVGGRVEWVAPALVSGGRFAAGEVLLRIEAADYRNAVEIASAEVAERQVAVLQAEEERALALEEYERLQAREGIEVSADSSELGSLIFREPQLEAARANLRRADARLRDAELALDRTRLRAPFDGVVRTETVDPGQYVTPGQGVARIYATDEVEIVVPLTDDEASLIAGLWEARAGSGQAGRTPVAGSGADNRSIADEASGNGPRRGQAGEPIPATVSAVFGGRRYAWEGYVDRAEGALNEETRTVDVIVIVPDPFTTPSDTGRPPLLLGTYVDVEIQGAELDHYVVIPRAAFRDGDVVWTVEADSVLRVIPAALIQEVGGSVHVAAEVEPRARIIVSPLDVVTDGMGVRVAEDPSS